MFKDDWPVLLRSEKLFLYRRRRGLPGAFSIIKSICSAVIVVVNTAPDSRASKWALSSPLSPSRKNEMSDPPIISSLISSKSRSSSKKKSQSKCLRNACRISANDLKEHSILLFSLGKLFCSAVAAFSTSKSPLPRLSNSHLYQQRGGDPQRVDIETRLL